MKADSFTKENLRTMVNTFYVKVIKDNTVGPFFIEKLGDDMSNERWVPHLDLLVEFWASITLGETGYRGNPFMPHTQLGELKQETFGRWLTLFSETLDEIYVPVVANQLKERSTIIASNFMRNLNIA